MILLAISSFLRGCSELGLTSEDIASAIYQTLHPVSIWSLVTAVSVVVVMFRGVAAVAKPGGGSIWRIMSPFFAWMGVVAVGWAVIHLYCWLCG